MDHHFTHVPSKNSFRFSCGPHVSCFNECCRDLNQFLTPYDIVRLKTNLKISSDEFLKRYTTQHTGPESGLPIVRIKENPHDLLKCPFVTQEGCLVYPDRPSSCRAYPLARAVIRDRKTGNLTEYYMLLKEPHCKGFLNGNNQSVQQWIENQGLPIYNEMNDMMMEIISLKNQLISGMLDIKARHFFYMACYNIDVFREKIFNKGFLTPSEYDNHLLKTSKTEDTALLKISLRWIQKTIFSQAG